MTVDDVWRLEASVFPDVSPPSQYCGAVHSELVEYPELELVLGLAVSAVIEAYPWTHEADAASVFILERAAIDAMVTVYAPIAIAARRTAAAVEDARRAKAADVSEAAEALAVHQTEVATALQVRGDATARQMATDAATRADVVAATIHLGDETVADQVAAKVAAEVRESAVALVIERAVAADLMTQRVALAVSKVAKAAEAEALAVELQSLNAALTVEAIAIDTCYRLALEAATSAAHGITASTMESISPH